MDKIRFPIGQFEPIINPTFEDRVNFINQIPEITKTLRSITKDLKSDQLNIPYRQDGWTIKQIAHHLADNDMNAYLGIITIDTALQRFVWHDLHHISQIESLIKSSGWSTKEVIIKMNASLDLFVRISVNRMHDHYLLKLARAIESINKEDLWYQEQSHMNSIGGIVLHICEHINRHIIRYSSTDDTSGGIENYFPNLGLQPEDLLVKVRGMFAEWKSLMNKYLAGDYDIEMLDMNDIYHLVEHTGYHLGQIVDRTQRINKTLFQFVQNGINEKNLKKLLEEGRNT